MLNRKSHTFEVIIDYKKFMVTYDLYSNGQKSIANIEHNDLPIDEMALQVLHAETYEEILAAMDNNAHSHNRDEVFERLGDILRPAI